jgi:hypothetical protein
VNLLRFPSQAVRTWADYSGDFNPIHFDERVAEAAIGKGGIVVHGMLAMLPLKTAHSALRWEGDGWVQWTAMLRQPMPQHFGYAMESRVALAGRKVRFKLSAMEDGEAKITGHCSTIDVDASHYPDLAAIAVPAEEARRELARFSALFPEVSPAWIVLDAMAFSRYIRLHAEAVFRDQLTRHFGEGDPDATGSGRLVTMQTHHTVTFCRALLCDAVDLEFQSFAYAYAKTDELISENSVFATVDIPVWLDGRLAQVIQIGLMARKLSSFNPK